MSRDGQSAVVWEAERQLALADTRLRSFKEQHHLPDLTSNMANAIRSRTVQKGVDPRQFALVAFGGAGPLHAADVAAMLGITEVIVPPYPGITSAGGLRRV